ncbi:diguanylate cyclase [Motiliproteus sp.]|uniref:GGDEF domain-containing protein n=1 Tax=Motiliproteus sp. TaxID=1898955 RepID=UPI003BA9D05A
MSVPKPLQFLQPLLLPLLLFGSGWWWLPQVPLLSAPWEQLLPYLPYLLTAPIILLGWHFNSGRSLLAAGWLLLTDFSLQQQLSALYIESLLVLLPLNLALISWYAERGTLGLLNLMRWLLILAQLGLCLWLVEYQPQWLQQGLSYVPNGFAALPNWITNLTTVPLNFISALSLPLALTALLIRLMLRPDRFNAYLLVSTLLALTLILEPQMLRLSSLLISLMLLLWLFALLRHSHGLAYLDELTGLPGRRALNEHLKRLGRHYCLAMLDVDHFKKFNDRYGHDVGDQVLRLVAAKLSKVRLGKAYRYGGEEFCVVFPGRDLEQTLAPLEEIRQTIEQARMKLRDQDRPKSNRKGKQRRGKGSPKGDSVSVTISIGVAQNEAKSDCLKAADKALYRAKSAGRNRVCR